jgi:hypothetical protein
MRRAALPAIGILGFVRIAGAEPWSLTMESGAEADTNVERVETVEGGAQRIAAPAARAGARIDHHDYLLGGSYLLRLSGLARMVVNADTKPENVMLYAGEARWLRPVGSRPIAAGIHLVAADSFAITGGTGARTFRNLGGEALLVLGGDDHHLTLGVGGRDFRYKPDHDFDWRGPVADARLDVMLWQTSGKTESLELATTLGFEARSYQSAALAGCSTLPGDVCNMTTALRRNDRYQRASAELSWTGHVVATGGYQLTVIDSNSYGQSLIRQRIVASATMELPGELFATATATLQVDQYPDGILIEKDVQHQEFTNLEDENRSSLQVHFARELSPTWSLEARGAIWRDFASTDTSFRRELIYLGVIYAR